MSIMVRMLSTPPGWLVVERRTVASAVTHRALEVRRAEVMGQLGTGITAWRLDTSKHLAPNVLIVVSSEIADYRVIARFAP